MRLILADDPVRVMASAGQAVNHRDERYGGEAPDIWDHGYVIVDFARGARAMLDLCMFAEGSRYQEELAAMGPAGKIEAHVPGPTRFWPEALGPAPVPELVVSPRAPRGRDARRCRSIPRCSPPATTTAPPSSSTGASPMSSAAAAVSR